MFKCNLYYSGMMRVEQVLTMSMTTTATKLKGKVTEADLRNVRKMMRSKMYWPKLLLASWYGLALICIVLSATISGLVGATKPNWQAVGVLWLVIAASLAWAAYSTKRRMAREFIQLNAALPEWITLARDGLRFEGPNGANGFQPWSNFKKWREGECALLLEQSQGGFVILPISDLSDVERQGICNVLRSYIPQ
jgi:hypothetical protein